MSVITDAVEQWKRRLAEIEQQIAPLVKEADQLREAIGKIDGRGASAPSTAGASRAGGRGRARTSRASSGSAPSASASRGGRARARTPTGRAPRGQNRQQILASIQAEAKTAGQIAAETGIGRGTVATTLTKLVKEGAATKAPRGYRAG